MKLNHNSWHYRMANYGMKRIWREDKTDFCSYSRMVAAGFLVWSLVRLFILTMIIWTGYSWYQYYLYFTQGITINDIAQLWYILMLSIVSGITVVSAIYGGNKLHRRYKEKNRGVRKEPSFFGLLYRKWKEKTCFMVEID